MYFKKVVSLKIGTSTYKDFLEITIENCFFFNILVIEEASVCTKAM